MAHVTFSYRITEVRLSRWSFRGHSFHMFQHKTFIRTRNFSLYFVQYTIYRNTSSTFFISPNNEFLPASKKRYFPTHLQTHGPAEFRQSASLEGMISYRSVTAKCTFLTLWATRLHNPLALSGGGGGVIQINNLHSDVKLIHSQCLSVGVELSSVFTLNFFLHRCTVACDQYASSFESLFLLYNGT